MGDPVSLPSPEISSMAEEISSPAQVCRTDDLEKKRKFQGQLRAMEILPSSSSACWDIVAEFETGPSSSSSSSGVSPKRLKRTVNSSNAIISSGASNTPTADSVSSPHDNDIDIEASAASSSSFIHGDCDESGHYCYDNQDEQSGNNDAQWITPLNLPPETQGTKQLVITIDKEFEEYFSQLLL